MKQTAKCGHTIDIPFKATNFVCKDCFGFEYTTNSYRTIGTRLKQIGHGKRASVISLEQEAA